MLFSLFSLDFLARDDGRWAQFRAFIRRSSINLDGTGSPVPCAVALDGFHVDWIKGIANSNTKDRKNVDKRVSEERFLMGWSNDEPHLYGWLRATTP